MILVTQMVKNLPAMRETRVWSLGQEDPLEKEMATHFSTLTWKIPWMEEPGGLQSMESQRVGNNWATSLSLWTFFGIPFLWDWNEHYHFQSCGHYWVSQICWHIECSTFTPSSLRIWNSSAGIPSPPVVLFSHASWSPLYFAFQDVWL